MADASNGINFMAMLNPQFAAQQQKFALQQAMAQQMMEEGSKAPPDAQLANPGGQVIANSPWAALSRATEKGLGAYSAQKAIGDNLAASLEARNSTFDSSDPLSPRMDEMMLGMGEGGLGKAKYEARTAGIKKGLEEGSTLHADPEGGYRTYPVGNQPPPVAPQTPTASMVGNNAIMPPADKAAATNDLLNGNDAPANPVNLPGASDQAAPKVPMAGDGTPLLPNMNAIPAPNPQSIPDYKTPNTNSGVNLNKQLTDADVKANGAFANESQSLAQEQTRIQNLIDVYQQVKSGGLTAQNPEFFQKLAAAGINDNPEQLKTLAGVQNATQNHILQIIGQIKDTNASLEGGAASRTFGSTINKLTEEGESAKDQPEALWNIISQAKGQVDHHLDMMRGYQAVGGLGNRLNNNATMPADTFATQFTIAHPIDNYVKKAQETIAPFKGMPGNIPSGATPFSPQDIQAELKRRKLM